MAPPLKRCGLCTFFSKRGYAFTGTGGNVWYGKCWLHFRPTHHMSAGCKRWLDSREGEVPAKMAAFLARKLEAERS